MMFINFLLNLVLDADMRGVSVSWGGGGWHGYADLQWSIINFNPAIFGVMSFMLTSGCIPSNFSINLLNVPAMQIGLSINDHSSYDQLDERIRKTKAKKSSCCLS